MTVYKYPLERVGKQRVVMPYDAQILSAQMQDGIMCLWALVDPHRQLQGRDIWIHGTGHNFPEIPTLRHIDTVQDGSFVWHVFEGA